MDWVRLGSGLCYREVGKKIYVCCERIIVIICCLYGVLCTVKGAFYYRTQRRGIIRGFTVCDKLEQEGVRPPFRGIFDSRVK